MNSVIPLDQMLDQFLPILKLLLSDEDWKIRENTVYCLPLIFFKIENESTFKKELIQPFRELLVDKIFSVRRAIIIVIKKISKKLGQRWAEKQGLNLFHELLDNQNYLYRMNYLFGIGEIYKYISATSLEKEIGSICKMVKDPVPNIKAIVIKTLLRIYLGKQMGAV